MNKQVKSELLAPELRDYSKCQLDVIENEIIVIVPQGLNGAQYKKFMDETRRKRLALRKQLPAKGRKQKASSHYGAMGKDSRYRSGSKSRKFVHAHNFKVPMNKRAVILTLTVTSNFGYFITGDRNEIFVHIVNEKRCVVVDTFLNEVRYTNYASINTMYFERITAAPANFKMTTKEQFESALYFQLSSFVKDTAITIENLNLRNV